MVVRDHYPLTITDDLFRDFKTSPPLHVRSKYTLALASYGGSRSSIPQKASRRRHRDPRSNGRILAVTTPTQDRLGLDDDQAVAECDQFNCLVLLVREERLIPVRPGNVAAKASLAMLPGPSLQQRGPNEPATSL